MSDDITLKHCPGCPEGQDWHPATAEYFHRNKDKFHTFCKKCRARRSKESRRDPVKGEEIRLKQSAYYHAPERHERILAQRRTNSHRLDVHERNLARDKAYRNRPEIQEHRRLHMRDYNSRPEVRAHRRIYDRAYYYHPERIGQTRTYRNNYNRVYRKRGYVRERMRNSRRAYLSRPEIRMRHNAWQREYCRRADLREKRRESNRIYYRNYYSRPESQAKVRANGHARRARLKRVPGTHTAAQIADQLKRQHYCCYYAKCGYAKFQRVRENGQWKYLYHLEHTFPISRVVGMSIPANDMSYLVLACDQCNLSKGNKYPWEWPEGGRLL